MIKIAAVKKLITIFCLIVVMSCTIMLSTIEAAKEQKRQSLSTADQLSKELDNMVNTDEFYQVPGIGVIVYKDGKEVYSHFAGRAYIDESNPKNDRPITRNTRYKLGSISKVFTGISIMQLAEQGKIDLDADASEYLGFTLRNPNFPDTPITVRMLLAHTSSLRDKLTWFIPSYIDLRECFYPGGKLWKNGTWFAPKDEPPGEYYSYCDLNCVLLAEMIERLTGERFDKYQKRHVLKQLDTKADYVVANLSEEEYNNLATIYKKMDIYGIWNENGKWYPQRDDTSDKLLNPDAIYRKKEVLNRYEKNGNKYIIYSLDDYEIGKNPALFQPQGDLRMTLPELGNFLKMLGNNGMFKGRQVLKPESVKEMITPQWTYDAESENGRTEDGALVKYGLTMILVDGDDSARGCDKYKVDLTGHIGEAQGLECGAFILNDKPHDGFVFAVNGIKVDEESKDDFRGAGKFSGNYIWEEMVMDSIIRAMVEDEQK